LPLVNPHPWLGFSAVSTLRHRNRIAQPHPELGDSWDVHSITSTFFLSTFLVLQFVFWTVPGFLCFHGSNTMPRPRFQVGITVEPSTQKLRETAPSPRKVSVSEVHKQGKALLKKIPSQFRAETSVFHRHQAKL